MGCSAVEILESLLMVHVAASTFRALGSAFPGHSSLFLLILQIKMLGYKESPKLNTFLLLDRFPCPAAGAIPVPPPL